MLEVVACRNKLNYMLSMHQSQSVKTFVFQNEETQQVTFVESAVSLQHTFIDISPLLTAYCPPSQYSACIYDPLKNHLISLQQIQVQDGLIPRQYLESNTIIIRFQKKEEKKVEQSQEHSSELEIKSDKEVRSRERTIRGVIALVKRWRELTYSHKDQVKSNQRMNPQQAARELGISRKTLDDYYCQLGLAQLHEFNFIENMHLKMGKLKNFVKQHSTDESARINQKKQPKNLRVIQEFIFDREMDEYIVNQKKLADQEKMRDVNSISQMELENPFLNKFSQHKIIQNIEEDYYKGFQFLMDQPSDPFLCQNLETTKKFQEKDYFSLFL